MKVTLKWLKEYVNITVSPAELANRLTMAGSEVKEIKTIGGSWESIVVGEIIGVVPHPNADRLRLATVNLGTDKETVVCGAPNLRVGDKIAFAHTGAQLIDSHTGQPVRLKPAKIRGVESRGMVCSERELGISDSHEGIMVLPAGAPVGMSLSDYIGDTVIDLEITPNRPDCLSVIGIARETAALSGQNVRLPEVRYEETASPIGEQISIEILAPDLCPRYCASLISGVKVAPSPDWMQERLLACGMRPINNVVDITNYVMLEFGQPLHAFDHRLLGGRKIIVRRAGDGEQMVSLDGVERKLSADMLVIADEKRAVAVAGVMGGANTEVSDVTTTVLLEAASFKPTSIHATGDKLQLNSEARYRFERGISPELALMALKRATQLMVELGGGKAARGVVDLYPGKKAPEPVLLSADKARRLLGIDFTLDRIMKVLLSLGFECKPKEPTSILAIPPYWRSDIRLQVDLIEEVARIIGYDEIPVTLLGEPLPKQNPAPVISLKREIRSGLLAYGFTEVMNFSLTGMDMMKKMMPEPHPLEPAPIRVANPMTAEQEYLRLDFRANLLSSFAANRRYEDGSIRLFELGRVFLPRANDLPEEVETVCGVMGGLRLEKSWQENDLTLDFFDSKGAVEGLLQRLGIDAGFEKSADESLHPTRQAAIMVKGARVGVVGEVHPRVLSAFEIAEPVYLLEVNLKALLPLAVGRREFRPLPRFPAVVRDMALIIDAEVTHSRVKSVIQTFPLVEEVDIFDVYAGEQVPAGKKSLAYRIAFRSTSHTLTDDEVNKVQEQIVKKLAAEVGANLRS